MDTQNIVNLLTPVVVPIIIAGMKYLKPKIPTWLIPMIAPMLGGIIGYISTLSTSQPGNLWMSAALGLAGVGVREIIDQLKPDSEPKE